MSVNIKPYIIINGKNSNEITGLMITKLPPISKPAMRVEAEEIDGRDGDIVTELGFSAYDKEIEIGLYGEYDVNDVIEYFNQSGQVIFSNEPDKYYRFAIYNAIDFEKLINFKTATVTFHVQPFKFDVVSNDAVFFSPSNVSITNEGNIYSRPELAIQGSGNVGISVNGSDVLEIELGASQQAIIIDSDGMNAYGTKSNIKELIVDVNPVQDLHGYDHPWAGGAGKNKANLTERASSTTQGITSEIQADNKIIISGTSTGNGDTTCYLSNDITFEERKNYTLSFDGTDTRTGTLYIFFHEKNGSYDVAIPMEINSHSVSFTKVGTFDRVMFRTTNGNTTTVNANLQIEEGSTATAWTPYENICPISGWNGCDVTRTGANVCGGEFLANLIVSTFPNAIKDTTNKTISYTAVNASSRKLFDIFKPNTVYTFIIDTASANTNLAVNYTDGTSMRLYAGVNVTASNKSVSYLRGQNQSQSTVLNYENCGVFEGTITADDFQRYVGNPYQSFFEGLINGTYGYVDLGTLTWTYDSTNARFYATPDGMASNKALACSKYPYVGGFANAVDKSCFNIYNTKVGIKDSNYTDATEFTTAMSGVYLIYELATPTTPTITRAEINMLMTAFGIDEESTIVVFGQEVFGAKINLTTGVMTIEYMLGEFKSSDYWAWNSSLKGFRKTKADAQLSVSDDKLLCNALKKLSSSQDGCGILFRDTYFDFVNLDQIGITDVASWQAFINSFGGSIFVTYKLSQPIEVQLTAQEIMTLIGKNVLWADTGDINELIYIKDGVDITTSGDIVSFDVDAIDIIDTILKNRLVTGNYDNLRLKAGTNQIAVSGDVSVMVLSNFSRWL